MWKKRIAFFSYLLFTVLLVVGTVFWARRWNIELYPLGIETGLLGVLLLWLSKMFRSPLTRLAGFLVVAATIFIFVTDFFLWLSTQSVEEISGWICLSGFFAMVIAAVAVILSWLDRKPH